MLQSIVNGLKGAIPAGVKRRIRPLVGRFDKQESVSQGARPKVLSVEPTSRCNLNCPFCLVGLQNSLESTEHDLLPRGFGYMEMPLFERIVQGASEFGIETMQLHFQGEPLLHKKFPDMVKLVKARGMRSQVFTNGLPLTPAMADRILDSGLDMMRFSVDGASEESYQQNRVGGKFARVYENMRMMTAKAREQGSPIHLEWQMIALRNNEHEIEEAERMAQEIGINFFVKSFAVTDPELVPQNPKYRRGLQPKPCLDIYRAIFVYFNGDVVPCCYDQEGHCIVGNLGENSLEEVWNSPEYTSLRHRIDNAETDPENEPEICKSCLKWGDQSKMDESSPLEIESAHSVVRPTDFV